MLQSLKQQYNKDKQKELKTLKTPALGIKSTSELETL